MNNAHFQKIFTTLQSRIIRNYSDFLSSILLNLSRAAAPFINVHMSDKKPTTSSKAEEDSKKSNKNKTETEEDSHVENIQADQTLLDRIEKFFASKLNLSDRGGSPNKIIEDLSFEGLTKHWKSKGFKKILTMVGAGISTSAGIPDFRSPGSGLYDNLQKYNLPHPTAIFEMDYFEDNPQPFFALAKELYPGTFRPTPAHYFVRLLHDKGLLLRHYTQNIDTLERIAGIPEEKLVEAHGTFYTNHCLRCRKKYSMQWMKKKIFDGHVPTCEECNGVVKPDIVFFGENLPEKFYTLPSIDFQDCDLLIIMGTSLEVQPFASLVDHVKPHCVRLLINRTKVGHDMGMVMFGPGLLLDSDKNTRDVAYIGDCDDAVAALTDALGWSDELRELIERETALLDKENEKSAVNKKDSKKENSKKIAGAKDETKICDTNAETSQLSVEKKADQPIKDEKLQFNAGKKTEKLVKEDKPETNVAETDRAEKPVKEDAKL